MKLQYPPSFGFTDLLIITLLSAEGSQSFTFKLEQFNHAKLQNENDTPENEGFSLSGK